MKIVPDIMAKDERGRTSKKANWCKEASDIFILNNARGTRGYRARHDESCRGEDKQEPHELTLPRHFGAAVQDERQERWPHRKSEFDRPGRVREAGSNRGCEERKSPGPARAAINLSLLTLGKIINMLAKRQKVNSGTFRESKLTRLLQDSLGGNAYLMMMTCMSPAMINAEMTRSTAQFGQRCRGMKSVTKVNYSKSIEEYERDLALRDEQLVLLGSAVKTLESHNINLAEELDQAENLLDEITGKKKEAANDAEVGGGTAAAAAEPRPSQLLKTERLEQKIDSAKVRATNFIGSDKVKQALANAAAAEARMNEVELEEEEDILEV